jgi:CysZ protein
MITVPHAFARAFGQLGDRRVLAVLAKSLTVTLAVFAALGAALWYGLTTWQPMDGDGDLLSALAAGLVMVVALWLLFRFVALAVLQFFADDVVRAVELRHYPVEAAAARALPFGEDVRSAAAGLGRALVANAIALPIALVLLVTGVGTALVFWAVNSWLLGRELTDMVWLRHRPAPSPGETSSGRTDASPLSALTRFALGGIVAGMLLVPFLNLLAPVIGAAAATHLVHGRRRMS